MYVSVSDQWAQWGFVQASTLGFAQASTGEYIGLRPGEYCSGSVGESWSSPAIRRTLQSSQTELDI
eukprot:15017670-Alexandrium_andersonii.AAC.1